MKKTAVALLFLLICLFLVNCASVTNSVTPSPTPSPQNRQLTLYWTRTPTNLPTAPLLSPTPLPSLTPTPRTHTVQAGEDLGGIAYRYGVTVSAILEANPGIDPYLLSVGSVLIIPPSIEKPSDPTQLQQPTPIPIQLDPPVCHLTGEGGAWCFILAHGSPDSDLENVSARLRVIGQDGTIQNEAVATAPLNRFSKGEIMPLAVYLAPPLSQPFQASAELLTALPLKADDTRYLPVRVENLRIQPAADHLSVQVNGELWLANGDAVAQAIWIAVAGYDKHGQPVGLRRLETRGVLSASQGQPFSLWVYSLAGEIAEVKAWAEARP
ncbi:MAG: LysM domain-containing protein [Anaerolineales bacterium]